jgi:predicted dehydrogenase
MDENGRPMGVLVIGAGWLGSRRASAAVACAATRLAGVFDVEIERARRVADRHGALAAPDLATALELPGVDAVVVATPHADHAGLVRRALMEGKHVLCEKPLAIDAEEARGLADLADRRRLRLATGLNHRFYPPVRDALRLVQSGMIGRVESVRVEIGHRAPGDFLASWHIDVVRSGGGTLMDNGPHACDLIRGLLGEVVAAKGYTANALGLPEGCESDAFALFRNHDRGVAELRSSWTMTHGYLTIDVRGEVGRLRVETAPWRLAGLLGDGQRVTRRYFGERAAERLHRLKYGCERSLVLELEAFASPVPMLGNANGWDGCRATEMIQAVYLSAETGDEVLLEPLPVLPPTLRCSVVAREGS